MTGVRHLTASMVVIDPDTTRVLLVHHNASNLWLFPGGHIDPGETPAEAAHAHIDLLFVGTADSSSPLVARLAEVAAVRWVPAADLAGLDVRAEVPAVAGAALRFLTQSLLKEQS